MTGTPRPRDVVCGVLAGLLLIGLVIGSPIALYLIAGSPLPSRVPDVGEILDLLTSRDDGTLFIGLVEIIAWGAWTAFAFAVLAELAARVRGHHFAPRLPGLGAVQGLAAMLIASATLAMASPASAAGMTPPTHVTAAPLHPLASGAPGGNATEPDDVQQEDGHVVYRVKRGDSLWKIADHEIGSPSRWSKIWRLNAHSHQPGGHVFRDPSLIRPGWRLRLPSLERSRKTSREQPRKAPHEQPREAPRPTHSPVAPALTSRPTPPPTPPRTEAPAPQTTETPAPSPSQESSAPSTFPITPSTSPIAVTVELPSGSLVGMAFVAGISTAYVAGRFQRRRRHVPAPASEGVAIALEPEPAPVIRQLRRAHMRSFTDRGEEVPSDRELIKQAYSIDVPGGIVIGERPDGTPAVVNLSGLNLGLTGQGVHDVVRYLLIDVLRQAGNFRAEVVICTALAQEIFNIPAEELESVAKTVAGFMVAPEMNDAVDRFEQEHFTRLRMMVERNANNIDELRERDPGEVLPAIFLVTALNDDVYARVGAILASQHSSEVGALLLGDWPTGTTCHVDKSSHRVSRAAGPIGDDLLNAQLCHLTADEAVTCLRELAGGQLPDAGEPAQEDSPASAESEIWSGPELVRLSVLGPPLVQVSGEPKPVELIGLQLQLLVFLALHPHGATREELSTALWPDETGKDVHNTLRHLRDCLVTATGFKDQTRKKAPFISASTTGTSAVYRIDPKLISVDLWDYLSLVDQAKGARDDPTRIDILLRATQLCRAELAKGLHYEWLEEHRYPLTRSQADTLAQLAELCEKDDPQRALEVLERTRELDPDNEAVYIRIIKIQLRLGHPDRARRTADLLRQHLRAMGLEPTAPVERQLIQLLS